MRPTRAAKTKAVAQIETATKKISRDDDDSHLDETPAIPDDTIQEAEFKLPKRKSSSSHNDPNLPLPSSKFLELSAEVVLSITSCLNLWEYARVAITCQPFHTLLLENEYNYISARRTFFADPPSEISEESYKTLLFKRGCDYCENARTRKVFWKCSLSRHYTVYSYLLEEVAAQKEVYESLLLEEWAAWHQERSEFYRQRSHEISHIVAAVNLYNLELSEDKQLRNEKRQDAIRAHIAEDCKDIPMEMIRRCPAYVRAMKSDTECTVRSWNTLRRKIEEFAVEEQRLKDERERLQREKEVRREECKAMICEKAEEFV